MMEDSNPWPANTFLSTTVPSVAAQSYAQIPMVQTFVCTFPSGLNPAPNNMRVDQAYVMIDKIVLNDAAGNPVDWVTLDDFSQNGNYGTTNTTFASDLGQMSFAPGYPGQRQGPAFVTATVGFSGETFVPTVALGLAKNDPQVRFPISVWNAATRGAFRANGFPSAFQYWKRVVGTAASGPGMTAGTPPPTISFGQANSGVFDATNTNGGVTGFSYLRPDPVTPGTTLLSHPHFVSGYRFTNGFKSVAQLGGIHTGLPWRTLRFQPTPATELAQGPPDWILLDAFTATNPAASLPMINVNAVPMALRGGTLGVATNLNGSVAARTWSLLSAMASAATNLPSASTNTMASNGVPLSLTNIANAYSNLSSVGSNITATLTNLVQPSAWSTNSGWAAVRSGRPVFPANGVLLRGEILEMRGVAENTNTTPNFGEDVIEGRLRSFLDLVTTRSDTFSVWSIGQGLMVNTNLGSRTNIMGEVRKQTVFQRVPQTDAAGNLTGYQVRVLYTRNHVVE